MSVTVPSAPRAVPARTAPERIATERSATERSADERPIRERAAPERADRTGRLLPAALLAAGALIVVAVLVWQAIASHGTPDPLARDASAPAAVLDIGVLVFREGLECILVLAAITASMVGAAQSQRRPIAVGVLVAMAATLVTWFIAVRIIDNLTESIPALDVQAATGLLAIVVLLVVMNWFFHKLYWTGWISLHTRKKRKLVREADTEQAGRRKLLWGLGLLGFSSFYREGFEVVLFLQNYRMKLGGTPVLEGVLLGIGFTSVVAALTFVANRHLPYRRMLVFTGVLLGAVLLVMVGEEAQEMQLAGWISTTTIPSLTHVIPDWAGMWFAIFPTVETLVSQAIAAVLVLGSYTVVRVRNTRVAATA